MSPSGKKVTVPVSVLKRFTSFAIVLDYDRGVEKCLYCTWHAKFRSDEEVNRQLRLPAEEQRENIRQFEAAQQHDKRCVVVRSRVLLGVPNPRAVYVPQEETTDDPE